MHWTTFPAPSVNTVSERVVLSACIELTCLDPDSMQITIAASPSVPAATRSILIEECCHLLDYLIFLLIQFEDQNSVSVLGWSDMFLYSSTRLQGVHLLPKYEPSDIIDFTYSWSFMFCITRTGLFAVIMTMNFKVHMVSHDCNVKSRLEVVITLCLLLQSFLLC